MVRMDIVGGFVVVVVGVFVVVVVVEWTVMMECGEVPVQGESRYMGRWRTVQVVVPHRVAPRGHVTPSTLGQGLVQGPIDYRRNFYKVKPHFYLHS
jgi:hypothetical protein